MAAPTYKLRVPNHLVRLIRTMHPNLKRKVKASLKTILASPHAGKGLRDELSGLRSFRVGHFRIIYSISGKKMIELVGIGPRERIYEETYRVLKREKSKR